MSEDTAKKTKDTIRRVYLAPVVDWFNNLRDYSYKFRAFVIKDEVVVTQEVIFRGPELAMLEDLVTHPAFIYMKERYGQDPIDVFMGDMGRMGTGPAYVKATDEAGAEAAGKAAQVEADMFKPGQRKVAAPKVSAEQKQRLNAYETMAIEKGCVNEDGTPDMVAFDELVKSSIAKKKK